MRKINYLIMTLILIQFMAVPPVFSEFKYYEKVNEDVTYIHIDKIPVNVDEFLALRNIIAKYPEGGLVMLVLAARIYVENNTEGIKCFTIALSQDNLVTDASGYKGYKPDSWFRDKLRYLDQMPYMPNSYFVGTSPDNGYKLPAGPWKFIVSRNKYSEQSLGLRLFITSSGADSPRPFTVQVNDKGYWKIADTASSLFVGIRKPAEPQDDDL